METDSFFCQLFKELPQTLFYLLGLPPELARAYRFDSVEVKKSLRIDGVFLPNAPALPAYFVEVLFRRLPSFYANLFAKVFLFMEANPSVKDWRAVALFESRKLEPKHLDPYEDLLQSKRVTRIYLDQYPMPADPPVGLGILQVLSAPDGEVKQLVSKVVHKAKHEIADGELGRKVIGLVEELLMRRFTQLDREEIRSMFKLHDLKESKVWQEAHQTGIAEGREEGREEGEILANQKLVRKWLGRGMSVKQIADLMDLPAKDVRRLARDTGQ